MARKVIDCRDFPTKPACSIVIMGEEDELSRAAKLHALSVHGHKDSPELEKFIQKAMKDESEFFNRELMKKTG